MIRRAHATGATRAVEVYQVENGYVIEQRWLPTRDPDPERAGRWERACIVIEGEPRDRETLDKLSEALREFFS